MCDSYNIEYTKSKKKKRSKYGILNATTKILTV